MSQLKAAMRTAVAAVTADPLGIPRDVRQARAAALWSFFRLRGHCAAPITSAAILFCLVPKVPQHLRGAAAVVLGVAEHSE
jgi:hypothetical protein